MFETITPEQAGISSRWVSKFIKILDKRGLSMHSVLLMKGERIFGEYYWEPFHRELPHRMYSQTKSFVGVAIGLLEEDGLLHLDDKIHTYFSDKLSRELPPYLEQLTIRQLLTMETAGTTLFWFRFPEAEDRTAWYFQHNRGDHPGGMQFHYDSNGSQVLSSLVERLTGKSLFDFLSERIFCHLGTFKNATILKTRNDDSFGDSALICTTRDMASFGRFVMNYGLWQGKRLMNEAYLRTATSRLVDNDRTGFDGAFSQGYGYQIWMVPGGFAFNGMGAQLTLCLPEKDLIFSCTADNQGYGSAKDLILTAFYELIVENMGAPLAEDPQAAAECEALAESLELVHLRGETESAFADEIAGKTYVCLENPMGITEFSLEFAPDGTGVFHYENAQGKKMLAFGMGKNVFGKFPQAGYSDLHAGIPGPEGHYYDCAASAVWAEPRKLNLRVQIIDKYLGNFLATLSFREDLAVVTMAKTAEGFLEEYQGQLVATVKK